MLMVRQTPSQAFVTVPRTCGAYAPWCQTCDCFYGDFAGAGVGVLLCGVRGKVSVVRCE